MSDSALPSPLRRWLIVVTVMTATVMQLLDTTVANVALPHMQAALGATPESVAWVLTSYIVAAAIATPITGWLESRIGRRALFVFSIIGFTVSSALCGMANSLEMMVAARTLQGIFGAFIMPLGQAIMLDSSPPEKHAQSMMIFTMGITLGPILGPVLGGWLTDNYGWRWVFFVNLPIGVLVAFGGWLLLAEPPLEKRRFDMVGFGFLALALASFQIMLDRGTGRDWFDSTEIIVEAGVAVGALWMFVVHSWTTRSPVVPLALFRDRSFMLASMFAMLLYAVIYSGSALLAPMLQILFGYDTIGSGMMLMPRALGSLAAMPVVTKLSTKIDPRFLVAAGLLLIAFSLQLQASFTLDMGKEPMIVAIVIQGLGTGLAFLPVTLMAFGTLRPELRTEGAALLSLLRNLGASIGISVMSALFTRNIQVNHADLSAHVTPGNIPAFAAVGLQHNVVLGLVDVEVNRQASMIAYLNDFRLAMWVTLIMLPLIIFIKRPRQGAEAPKLAAAD